MAAPESETAPKEIAPNSTLATNEEILPDVMIDPVVDEKAEPLGTASARESASQSDKRMMPVTAAVEAKQSAPPALQSPQPQVEGQVRQSNLQLEKQEGSKSEVSSLVEVRREKEQKELDPNLDGSQTAALVGESGANEAPKRDSVKHAVPALGSAEIQSSPLNPAKHGTEIVHLGDVVSIAKIHPKLAGTETAAPAPITPSELQSGQAYTVEQQPLVAHTKRAENVREIKSLVKPMPKALEGYIIQVPFKDRSEARTWADTFEQRGYAVSMTEAGGGESLRVRIGNFRLRDDAERQLRSIREDGLIGIILNLPQAYRPEVRSSLP
ncbi:MAG TPA: SPOR domain-containing protein [Candidatus Polarisedimenticolaceae bacterium]|nr:SPOR domain-containing protein [Candidatus Polarisedimenticolaceae bacterium]